MAVPDGNLLLTPQQISEELQGMVTPHTVTSWCRSGKLKATHAGRKWLIRRADLEAFLRTNQGGQEDQVKKAEPLAA